MPPVSVSAEPPVAIPVDAPVTVPGPARRARKGDLPAGATATSRVLDQNRVGVVFVHGIGTQPACETFLDWSKPIVEVLRHWCEEHEYFHDPVRRTEYDLSGTKLPILELDVPAHDGHPEQRWVLTEAWWASVTRPPSLGSMTSYVSRALPRIMDGIREGYRLRGEAWRGRQERLVNEAAATDPAAVALLAEQRRHDRRWVWIDWLDSIQKELTILAFGPALVLGTVALALYAPFRAIPIQAIRDLAVLKSADNFLTRWFGELPDILDDPVQAANVRWRLANAIRGLRAEGCGRIVVIAHSGGAIVSFTTLLDPAYRDEQVDKLITLGEGLALAWRIEDAYKGLPRGSRLAGNLNEVRPALRWADFWSSYDPAPAGPLRPPSEVHLNDETHPSINRMSLLEDHGSYWDNDEEFVIPLLRHLDTPTGTSSESRFFRNYTLETVRLERRRQRVAVLALWRCIATLGAAVPLTLATITGLLGVAGHPGPARLGEAVARWWWTLPFGNIVAAPLNAVASAANGPVWMRDLGEWGLGVALVALAFLILARIGVGRWEAWDLRERVAARYAIPRLLSRRGAFVTFATLTLVAVAMAVGTLAYLWR